MRTIRQEVSMYRPALIIDRYLGRRVRKFLRVVLGVLLFVLGILAIVPFEIAGKDIFAALFFLLIPLFAVVLLLGFFFNTLFFRGLDTIISEGRKEEGGITYEVAEMLLYAPHDITRGFLATTYGEEIMKRCGVNERGRQDLLRAVRNNPLPSKSIKLEPSSYFTIEHLADYILRNDTAFAECISSSGALVEAYYGAASWVMHKYRTDKYKRRWWGRDNLAKKGSIGRMWSFGVTYSLDRYIKPINTSAVFSTLAKDVAYADEKIDQIETILIRQKDANIILVGDHGVGKMDLLVRLGQKIARGESIASIERKRLVVFDADAFVAVNNSKQEFEEAFLKMLKQADKAGNLIIVIENLAHVLKSIKSFGSDAGDLMDQYLASPNVQFIATSVPREYHQSLESMSILMGRFAVVQIESPDLSSTIRVLEDTAAAHEKEQNVTFTYASIQAIADSADRYITEGVMPEKAVDLMVEIAPAASNAGVHLIDKAFVQTYVSERTGIPSGPVSENERALLLNLEGTLHKYVIGQNHAIEAISSAMRRARAGIGSSERPLGSFLFLGSTGVGKTETAKALARVFFGDKDKMIRLDMSEFNDEDGLSRLIGEQGSSGVLADMLREHPYGVLLLDEFEKASSDVHDLFLQILDEGIFTDARGDKVNARNTIIIATSNAGSDLIWDVVKQGGNPTEHKDDLIDKIISGGIYKPELVNRFDDVVVFEPLAPDVQEQIAGLMLGELKDRVKKQGFELVVNDVLIRVLTTKGYNPQFGARPMRRMLQDEIEEAIAKKILEGNLKPGSTIEFSDGDFD